jgi:hypothetical protein
MYYDFYVYTPLISNFERPFEITRRLVESVDREVLQGYNFNRYGSEGNDDRFHFTIRMNLSDVTQKANVIAQLAQMQNQGIIDDYTDDNPLVIPPFRNYSINHHLAHETSTQCAFRFYEKKVQNLNKFNQWWRNPTDFLTEFLPLWLKYSGYSYNQIDEVAVSPITCIEELANECGTIVRQVDRNAISDFSIFNERLVHTLFNCVSDLIIEGKVREFVGLMQGYDSFNELLQDLTFV